MLSLSAYVSIDRLVYGIHIDMYHMYPPTVVCVMRLYSISGKERIKNHFPLLSLYFLIEDYYIPTVSCNHSAISKPCFSIQLVCTDSGSVGRKKGKVV